LRNLRFRLVGGIKQAYSKWHYRPERLEYYFLIWHVCITGDGNRIQHTDTLTTLDKAQGRNEESGAQAHIQAALRFLKHTVKSMGRAVIRIQSDHRRVIEQSRCECVVLCQRVICRHGANALHVKQLYLD